MLHPESITVDPALAGWNAGALQDVVAYVQGQKSTGFLIIDDGRIVSEHNWPLPPDAAGFAANFTHGKSSDGALIEDVASAQKSFIALLAAIAIDKRMLDIEKPVTGYLGDGWSQADAEQERGIKVRNLMEMSSGLSEKLDMTDPVGAKFFYNTPAYALMKPILEKASSKTLDEISRDWLILPAGLHDTSWAKRSAAFADAGNPTGLATTPRDLSKLGQLVLDGGAGRGWPPRRLRDPTESAVPAQRHKSGLWPPVVAERIEIHHPARRQCASQRVVADPRGAGRSGRGAGGAGPQALHRSLTQTAGGAHGPGRAGSGFRPAGLASADEGRARALANSPQQDRNSIPHSPLEGARLPRIRWWRDYDENSRRFAGYCPQPRGSSACRSSKASPARRRPAGCRCAPHLTART